MTEETDGSTNGEFKHFHSLTQAESYTQRRPRLSIDDWIDINDFKTSTNTDILRETYKNKEGLNQLLNDTYVAMEKAEELNGWSARKKKGILEWKNLIEYQFTVNWFFVYDLKKKEGWWAWIIIVISTITSTLSLVRPTDPYVKLLTEWFLSFFSIVTTLVAAWIKKQNYVDRIKNIDRYIQKLSKLNVEIEYAMTKPPWERKPYEKFIEIYETEIVQLLSSPPPMAPEEFKTAVWQLTRFYPELVKDTYPWYSKTDDGIYSMTEWGENILKTYSAVYYSSTCRKIFSCYYCTCRCFSSNNMCCCQEESNYITNLYKVGSETAKAHTLINNQWLPPTSESLSRQLEEHNFSTSIVKNLSLKEMEESMINGDSIIEMAHTQQINEREEREKREKREKKSRMDVIDEKVETKNTKWR